MFQIQPETFRRLTESWTEQWIDDLVILLRKKYNDRVPTMDLELRSSIKEWIQDAVKWGLAGPVSIAAYVESRAKSEGRREPLESRLMTYFHLYHPVLINKVNLESFTPKAVAFARDHNVLEEEGITWLSLILLAGIHRGDFQIDWVASTLRTANLTEEQRVGLVHKKAAERGWLRSEG